MGVKEEVCERCNGTGREIVTSQYSTLQGMEVNCCMCTPAHEGYNATYPKKKIDKGMGIDNGEGWKSLPNETKLQVLGILHTQAYKSPKLSTLFRLGPGYAVMVLTSVPPKWVWSVCHIPPVIPQ